MVRDVCAWSRCARYDGAAAAIIGDTECQLSVWLVKMATCARQRSFGALTERVQKPVQYIHRLLLVRQRWQLVAGVTLPLVPIA